MNKSEIKGHLLAIFTIFIWGTTFTSTKVLLEVLSPVEILFTRFFIGFIALTIFYPYKLPTKSPQEELYFLGAGITGITFYYLFENIALSISLASHIGIIISIAPFFTAILAHKFLETEKISTTFIISFLIAMTGVILVGYSGNPSTQKASFGGDFLAILAALSWGIYSILVKKIEKFNYNIIGVTRHIFFYGILFMCPAVYYFGFKASISTLTKPIILFNLVFLGLGASALCFFTWNSATKYLGAIKTSMYIYASPIISTITAIIVLDEKITLLTILGAMLLLLGLFIAERRK